LGRTLVIIEGLIFAMFFVRAPRDKKAFAAKAAVFLVIVLGVVVIEGAWDACWQTFHMFDRSWAVIAALAPIFLLGVIAGPAWVARVPLVGPALVRFVLGRALADDEPDGETDESGDESDREASDSSDEGTS